MLRRRKKRLRRWGFSCAMNNCINKNGLNAMFKSPSSPILSPESLVWQIRQQICKAEVWQLDAFRTIFPLPCLNAKSKFLHPEDEREFKGLYLQAHMSLKKFTCLDSDQSRIKSLAVTKWEGRSPLGLVRALKAPPIRLNGEVSFLRRSSSEWRLRSWTLSG